MPCLTYTTSPLGPCVDLVVSVSRPRHEALAAAHQPTPPPISIRGLIDTGAASTVIDAEVISRLEITHRGMIAVHTPSTNAGGPANMRQFDVSLGLFHPSSMHGALILNPFLVTEARLAHQGIQALIGRDILVRCLFVHSGSHFHISF